MVIVEPMERLLSSLHRRLGGGHRQRCRHAHAAEARCAVVTAMLMKI
jgi:hypothetical protein